MVDPGRFNVGGAFPQQHHAGEISGRLSNNLDVGLHDVQIDEWMPGRYRLFARYGLVGFRVAATHKAFRSIDFQLEGLDKFFLFMPVSSYEFPDAGSGTISATLGALERTSSSNNVTVTCYYAYNNEMDGYKLDVSFAPTVSIEGKKPLSPEDWITAWLTPFMRVVSFANKRPCPTGWVVFEDRGPTDSRIRAQLFGAGIKQEVYTAIRPTFYENEDRPLFTVQGLATPLPTLVQTWRRLDASDNPFVELYRLAREPGLPPRARFLYLVQALEALHGFENRANDARRQTRHETTRAELLGQIEEGLGGQAARQAKRLISGRVPDSLDRRILALLRLVPPELAGRLTPQSTDPIVAHYREGGSIRFEEVVRLLRNDLSHGNFNPPTRELSAWVRKVEELAQSQLLRLLGFDQAQVWEALRGQ
jgi:hypothetical protein